MPIRMIDMKLEIDLVPKSVWYNNLRKVLTPDEWDIIRKQSYRDANHVCSICGRGGRLNCHEVWDYDEVEHVQILSDVCALCDDCHMIKHIGFAETEAEKGKLDMDALILHFCIVNLVDKDRFEEHRREAFALWHKRSGFTWTTDMTIVKDLLKAGGG